MALLEGCKHSLDISVPVDVVEEETSRVIADFQKRAKLRGFRPGKAPVSLIQKTFEDDIRQKVLENLVPKYLHKQFEEENLNVVGTPDISDVHLHTGEPLRFKAGFEVVPALAHHVRSGRLLLVTGFLGTGGHCPWWGPLRGLWV